MEEELAMHVDMKKVNPTARDAYSIEGPGIGGNQDVIAYLKNMAQVTIDSNTAFLDVGFGEGHDIVMALDQGAKKVCGVDLAQASLDSVHEKMGSRFRGRLNLQLLDVCHEPLPWEDDTFDVAVCTEAVEHFSNIYFAFAEIKRVLKHNGIFLVAFPDYNDNGHGYSGGLHAHVYPGFLTPKNFQKFMWQMYFHKPRFRQNGSSSWFAYTNYKGEGVRDIFHIIAGNFEEEELFGMLDREVKEIPAW